MTITRNKSLQMGIDAKDATNTEPTVIRRQHKHKIMYILSNHGEAIIQRYEEEITKSKTNQ